MNNRYGVDCFWSDEDEGFIAVVPDLPGCSAFGESRAEAAEQIEDAIRSWVSAAEAAGNPVPEPSARKSFEDYSGKVLLRMPKELHRDLNAGALAQGTSLNSYMCYLLTQKHYAHNNTVERKDVLSMSNVIFLDHNSIGVLGSVSVVGATSLHLNNKLTALALPAKERFAHA